jgi:hypothetical protein
MGTHVLDEESVHNGGRIYVGDCSMTLGLEQTTSHYKVDNKPEFVKYETFHLVMTIRDTSNAAGETTIKAYNVKQKDLENICVALQKLRDLMPDTKEGE